MENTEPVVKDMPSKEASNDVKGDTIEQPQPVVKSRPSREEKLRKKDDKSVEHVLKALNSLNTTEEKLAAMCKKYADIFDENRKLQLALKQAEKRCSILQREKEQLQTEHSKAILTRSRLENLCRELQRQNKAIKDESLLKIREEEERRKEVSAKFQTTLSEITALMQQNNDKNMKLRDDNIDMNAKLKNVYEQYELREQQVEKISKQMQLEAQLADAKLTKAKMEMAAEREVLLREKQQLLMDLSQYQARCQEFQATELNLRNQISMYDDKYDEFQKALVRSTEMFGGFKGEIEKMSKKICKLEKETMSWKQRWEGSHTAFLEMAESKQKADHELASATRQIITLQRLCRTLQSERTSLLAKLKELPPDAADENCNGAVTEEKKSLETTGITEPLNQNKDALLKESPETTNATETLVDNKDVNKSEVILKNEDKILPVVSQPVSSDQANKTEVSHSDKANESAVSETTENKESLPNSALPQDGTPISTSDNCQIENKVLIGESKVPEFGNEVQLNGAEETQPTNIPSVITETTNAQQTVGSTDSNKSVTEESKPVEQINISSVSSESQGSIQSSVTEKEIGINVTENLSDPVALKNPNNPKDNLCVQNGDDNIIQNNSSEKQKCGNENICSKKQNESKRGKESKRKKK